MSEFVKQGEAIHAGHTQVGHHDSDRGIAGNQPQRLGGIGRNCAIIAEALDELGILLEAKRIVINYQHPAACGISAGSMIRLRLFWHPPVSSCDGP